MILEMVNVDFVRIRKTLSLNLLSPTRWFYAFLPSNVANGGTQSLTALFVTQVLGGNVATVGQVSALTSLAAAPSSIFWGRLSDRTRRHKAFIILGFLGFGIPTILMGLSWDVGQFYILSLVLGFLAMASPPVASTLLMASFPRNLWPEEFGRFNQVGGWGVLAGRALGFLWLLAFAGSLGSEMSMRTLFILCGALSLFSAFLVWQWIHDPFQRENHSEVPQSFWRRIIPPVERIRYLPGIVYSLFFPRSLHGFRLASRGALGLYYLSTFLLFFGFLVAYTPFPVFLVDVLGASNDQVFGLGVLNAIASTLSYGVMGRQASRLGNWRVLRAAAVGRVGIFALFGIVGLLLTGPLGLLAIALLHTLSGVLWAAIATAGAGAVAVLSPEDWAGRAMGIYNAVIMAAAIVGSFAGGEVANLLGYSPAFFLGSLAVATGAGILFQMSRAQAEAGAEA